MVHIKRRGRYQSRSTGPEINVFSIAVFTFVVFYAFEHDLSEVEGQGDLKDLEDLQDLDEAEAVEKLRDRDDLGELDFLVAGAEVWLYRHHVQLSDFQMQGYQRPEFRQEASHHQGHSSAGFPTLYHESCSGAAGLLRHPPEKLYPHPRRH
jgi:hypothetical protein